MPLLLPFIVFRLVLAKVHDAFGTLDGAKAVEVTSGVGSYCDSWPRWSCVDP